MRVVKLKNEKFGTHRIYTEVSGFAIYDDEKGYLALSNNEDRYGITVPYMPQGGKKYAQAVLDGLEGMDGWTFVQSL